MGRHTSRFAVSLLILFGASIASAQLPQLYISSEGQSTLQLLNLNNSQLTTLYEIGGKPDDMTLNSSGQLIYSVPDAGTVNLWDPILQSNTVLASGIFGARDLEIEPGAETMLIAKYSAPAEIIRYNFTTGTQQVLVTKAAKLGTCDGIAYDGYGNLYAVADHNTIVQINPTTGAILATLVLEPHVGVNGADGLTWDPYTNSLWATHDGKTGIGLLQIFVTQTGFASTTSSGFVFYPFTKITNVDGIKSDGLGNLYIGAIWEALVYSIPNNAITTNIIVKGADGVSLVPGTF
jgi:sugar lactone lactonase YvrE